jgi:hypothetical protein
MNDQDQHEVTVRDNPDESRFDVFVEDTHAGLSAYKDHDFDDAIDPVGREHLRALR